MLKALTPIGLVAAGVVGAMTLVQSKEPVQTVRPEKVLPLVNVVPVRIDAVPLTVSAQGTVLPRTETTLASQVAAQVVAVSPHFEAGGFFERGEILVRLDRRDYELAVEGAGARVSQAELRLVQQQAEARVAAEEWRQLGDGEPDPLVLREPQMAEARAVLKAAEAELGMARLALERTAIRAPFAGRVRGTRVDVGQYLTPGEEVAQVHAIDYAEVRLPVPDRQLAFIDLPLAHQGDGNGPIAHLSANFTGKHTAWQGRIVRAEGELDRRSRMMHLVARVEDPYGRKQTGQPPMAVGLFVDAEIAGRTVVGALLPRAALRDGDRVLVVDADERLRWRDVDVLRTEKESVLISDGLETGERVCVSPLEVVVDGMEVRTAEIEGIVPASTTEPEAALAAVDVTPIVAPVIDERPASPDMEAASPTNIADTALPASARFLAIDVTSLEDSSRFSVSVDGEFAYSTSRLDAPARFVVDLLGVIKIDRRSAMPIGDGAVERVRIAQFQAEPEPITRLVFDLASDAAPVVEPGGDGLTVRF
ncbi:MAG: efflux RND transporter periplasmic adaptor subunit [bacterium]|nr:efflux RND transporter periplasmic adaptor subunit [bacterium]